MKNSIVGLVVGLLFIANVGAVMATTQYEAERAKGYADVMYTYATGDYETAGNLKLGADNIKAPIDALYASTFTAMQNEGWGPTQIYNWMFENYEIPMGNGNAAYAQGNAAMSAGYNYMDAGEQYIAYYMGYWLISAWGFALTAAENAEISFAEAVVEYQDAAIYYQEAQDRYNEVRSNLEGWMP